MKRVTSMEIDIHLKNLYNNRLMENEKEIQEFEVSLSKVLDYRDVSTISGLCLAFDDDTEQFEVMFGLVHAIESLYEHNIDEGLKLITNTIPRILNTAIEWIEILHYRILNHPQVRLAYGQILNEIDVKTADQIKGLLLDIKNEDPDKFSDAVDEVISTNY